MHIAWIDVVRLGKQTVGRCVEVVNSKLDLVVEHSAIETYGELLTLDEREFLVATTL